MLRIFAATAALTTAAPAAAHAQEIITSVDQTMLERLAAEFSETLQPLDMDMPGVRYELDGLVVLMWGNACEGGACQGLQIAAFWAAGPNFTASVVNLFDEQVPAVQAYLDNQSQPWLKNYVILDNGVTYANLRSNVEVFQSIAASFPDFAAENAGLQ